MSGFIRGAANEFDRTFGHTFGVQIGSGNMGPPPAPPAPPSQDAAANAAKQQQDLLRKRRGVLANIFGGSSGSQPAVTKATLGN